MNACGQIQAPKQARFYRGGGTRGMYPPASKAFFFFSCKCFCETKLARCSDLPDFRRRRAPSNLTAYYPQGVTCCTLRLDYHRRKNLFSAICFLFGRYFKRLGNIKRLSCTLNKRLDDLEPCFDVKYTN